MAPNVCQYWVKEPGTCKYWDSSNVFCTFTGDNKPSAYPFCNLLGTDIFCSGYYSEAEPNTQCILPDPSRHVCNRYTGRKWVLPEGEVDPDNPAPISWSFENINGYNFGLCDGAGTQTTCSGWSPYHMAFNEITPTDNENTDRKDDPGLYSVAGEDGLDFRLPVYYKVANLRALLSRCYWWDGPVHQFVWDDSTASGVVWDSSTDFKCINDIYASPSEGGYSEITYSTSEGLVVAPCNGAKPECGGYTGACWEWCLDEFMRHGDKILAEQVLELRYYMRRHKWTDETLANKFKYHKGKIYSWRGGDHTLVDWGAGHWSIGAIKHYLTDFDTFNVERIGTELTEGTETAGIVRYPTLVQNISSDNLSPLIITEFSYSSLVGGYYIEFGTTEETDVYIYGDRRYYSGDLICVNLNAPNMKFFLDELSPILQDDITCMSDLDYDSEEASELQERISCRLSQINAYMGEYLSEDVSSTVETVDPQRGGFFIFKTQLYFGENNIIVLENGSGRWEFDKIRVTALLSSGFILQNKSRLTLSDDGESTITGPLDYQTHVHNYASGGSSVGFSFVSINNTTYATELATIAYAYNDALVKYPKLPTDLSDGNKWMIYYKLIKKTYKPLNLTLENGGIRFFGNCGLCAITFQDLPDDFNYVHCPWSLSEYPVLTIGTEEDPIEIELDFLDSEEGTDIDGGVRITQNYSHYGRHEVNTFILKPRTEAEADKIKQICDATVSFGEGITYYVKSSYGESSLGSDVTEDQEFFGDDDVIIDKSEESSLSLNDYGGTIEDITGTQCISIAYAGGLSGFIKGIVKTKLMIDVKQPYCRDVEIKYSWHAIYSSTKWYPDASGYCCGAFGEEVQGDPVSKALAPVCGDHSFRLHGGTQPIGPMWYPYTWCENGMTYTIRDLNFQAVGLMECFKETDDEGNLTHGSWDMRMLGPYRHYLSTCGVGYSIWDNSCDYTHCNKHMVGSPSSNEFGGWGYIRCGVSEDDLYEMKGGGGSGPQFGNPYRDNVRIYRSFDYMPYIKANIFSSSVYSIGLGWIPVPYFFSDSVITNVSDNYPLKMFNSEDYTSEFYTDRSKYIDQFTFFRMRSISGKNGNEVVDVKRDGTLATYYQEELVKVSNVHDFSVYLEPKDMYYEGDTLQTVRPFYFYKKVRSDMYGSETITQWIYRSPWWPIERMSYSVTDLSCDSGNSSHYGLLPDGLGSLEVPDMLLLPPYGFKVVTEEFVEKKVMCLDVSYPSYEYDALMNEFRLVTWGGAHTLTFMAPSYYTLYDSPEMYNQFLFVKLDTGPLRAMNTDGEWDPQDFEFFHPDDEPQKSASNEGIKLKAFYDEVTTSEWSTAVTLFDGEASKYVEDTGSLIPDAEDDDRTITTYNESGDEVNTYFLRGLFAEMGSNYIPVFAKLCPMDYTRLYFLNKPVEVTDDLEEALSDTWSPAVPFQFVYNIDTAFLAGPYGAGESILRFEFDRSKFDFKDGTLGLINAIYIEFVYGHIDDSEECPEDTICGTAYHLPALEITAAGDPIFIKDEMKLVETKNSLESEICVATHTYSLSDIFKSKVDTSPLIVEVKMRTSPDSNEITDFYTDTLLSCTHKIKIRSIYFYYTEVGGCTETLNTSERVYYRTISTGHVAGYGDEDSGFMLTTDFEDRSTLRQHDARDSESARGITTLNGLNTELATEHVSFDRCRGRYCGEIKDDKVSLKDLYGNDLTMWEKEQEKIYNELVTNDAVVQNQTFYCGMPPALDVYLDTIGGGGYYVASSDFNADLTLVNQTLAQLSPVTTEDKYSPCGYEYYPRLKSSSEQPVQCPKTSVRDKSDDGFDFYGQKGPPCDPEGAPVLPGLFDVAGKIKAMVYYPDLDTWFEASNNEPSYSPTSPVIAGDI